MNMQLSHFKRILLCMLIFVGSSSSYALESSFDVVNFNPTTDNNGYFTVYRSRTLTPRQFSTGLSLDYGRRPLECDGCPEEDLIEQFLVGHYNFAVGAASWLQLGFDIPLVLYNDFVDDTTGQEESDGGIGDIRVEPKLRLLDIERYNVGLALVPFVTLPTGNGDKFEGSEHVTAGGKFVVDGDIGDRVGLSVNLGYRVRDDVTRTSTTVDDQVLYGAGMVVHATKRIDVIAETQGWTVVEDLWGSVAQSPLEAVAGMRYRADSGLVATLGAGPGLIDGIGTPTYRAFFGLGFTPPTGAQLKGDEGKMGEAELAGEKVGEAEARLKGDRIEINDRVYFDFDKAVIKPESYPILDAVAKVLKKNPQLTLVQVEGHTDSKGTDAYNIRLSERRCQAVIDYLIGKGIADNRFRCKGFGESRPIATNETAEGRAMNRRTEFHVLMGEK